MSLISFRGKALARLAVFCLGTSALTVPALSATFSVSGGTITTSQADTSADNTGSGGGFELQGNTTAANDTVAVNGVVISGASGRALDVGGQLASSGSYSVTMQGSSLTGGAGAWFQSVGGLISLDTTGGAANTMSGVEGLTVTNGSGNGGVALKLGADTITSTFEAVQAIGQGTGTISIDMNGTTVTSTGTYGVVAQNGLGNITIGGLNGGISGTINATSGTGILTGNIGNQNITLASGGVINAATGINVQGNTVNIDSFGTINATGDAITALNGTGPVFTITLEGSSVTKGAVVGGNQTNTFNIVAGADISNATFDGNGGTTAMNLTGPGNGTLVLSTASNITNFEMVGTGIWTLIGSPASTGAWTITSGTLRTFTSTNLNTVIINGGTFDLDNQSVTVGALSGTGGTIALGSGSLTASSSVNTTLASTISGTGSVIKSGSGTLTLTGANTYVGGTVVGSGTLQLGTGGSLASTGSLRVNGGTFDLNGHSQTVGTLFGGGGTITLGTGSLTTSSSANASLASIISGSGSFTKDGTGTLILTGANTYNGTTTISGGTLQVGDGIGGDDGAISGAVINNGALVFDYSSAFFHTLNGSISGTGSVTQSSALTLTLTGTNSYTGGTIISPGSTLQIGNGGSTGSIVGNVTDNGTLALARSDSIIFSGNISGTGQVTVPFQGSVTFTGTNTYTGGTTLTPNAVLRIGNGGTTGSLAGNINTGGSGALVIFNRSDAISFNGVISGSGQVLIGNGTVTLGGSNTYTGGTMLAGGTLVVSSDANLGASSAELQLSGGGNSIEVGTLRFGASFNLNGARAVSIGQGVATIDTNGFSTTISQGIQNGTGGLVKAGIGTLVLGGQSTYAGGTTVNAGTLQLAAGASLVGAGSLTVNGGAFDLNGNSQTVTALSGTGGAITLGSGSLTTSSSANASLASIISGSGSLTKAGTGVLTLTGTNSYSGATSVNAGTLNVTGSIAGSNINIAGGATLTGTGKVGSTTVASGGTLMPGSSATPGTLSIAGNLTLASGSNFSDAISSSAAGLASVSGTASIGGNAITNFASGTYANGQQYTLITAAGGVTGTFSSIATSGLPAALRGALSYDANDVYLNLKPNALAPSLASNTTTNQHNVVAAIDAAVSTGSAVPSGGFNALYGLTGPALNSAIDQISGQVGPNVSNAVGQSFLSFLAMTAEGGVGDAGSFAPGSAYGSVTAPHRAQLDAGQTRVWGGAYGGHIGLSGDAASGAASLSASNVGLIGGADLQLGDRLLAGVTLGWGQQHFNSGNGSGISTDYAFGLYGRADMDSAYATAAFGYGWHQITTLRVVTVSGTDVLQGKQNADDFGGRIEAGWRMALDDSFTAAPYAAFAGESFESPAYAETALSGASTFALSYAAHTSTLGRSELGAHLDRSYDLGNGGLTADVKAAWAHRLDDLPFTQANFENLATTGFQVQGVRPTRDSALLGTDIELQFRSGLFLGLKGEGQFGAGTTIVEGMGSFGLRW